MKRQELVDAIIEESKIHHNITIRYSKLPDTNEIDNEHYQHIVDSTAEFLVEDFKMNWENENDGEIWTCGRSGATIYWDNYWDESKFKYPDYYLAEDDWDKESLKEMLKDIRKFNKAVENLMEDFYACVNENISNEIIEKEKRDKKDKLYNKTLKLIKKKNFTKRLFYDLIYKKL